MLSAARGWSELTIADVAKAARIPLKDVEFYAPDKGALLVLLWHHVDDQACSVEIDKGQPTRDRVFDSLMNRFDVLQGMRHGLVPILRDFYKSPCDIVGLFPHLLGPIGQVMAAADVDATGIGGGLKTIGLSVVYLNSLRVWMDDDSEDLSKTMAALDTSLYRAERVAEWLRL